MGLPRLEADGSIVLNAVSLACGNGYGCACTNFRTARGSAAFPNSTATAARAIFCIITG